MSLIDRESAIREMRRLEQEDIDAYGAKIREGFDSEPAVEALMNLPDAEVTLEQVRMYCLKRRLCLLTSDLYRMLIHGYDVCVYRNSEDMRNCGAYMGGGSDEKDG